jgi:hypothetical protein
MRMERKGGRGGGVSWWGTDREAPGILNWGGGAGVNLIEVGRVVIVRFRILIICKTRWCGVEASGWIGQAFESSNNLAGQGSSFPTLFVESATWMGHPAFAANQGRGARRSCRVALRIPQGRLAQVRRSQVRRGPPLGRTPSDVRKVKKLRGGSAGGRL